MVKKLDVDEVFNGIEGENLKTSGAVKLSVKRSSTKVDDFFASQLMNSFAR